MIDVVTLDNRHLYEDEIEQMWRRRYEIYVRERGWRELDRPDGREIDQFDTGAADYLLAIEDGHRVVGGSRLVPTTEPTLMSDVFPNLAAVKGVPRSERIFEWTRYFVVPERREPHVISPVASAIMCGIQEYGLSKGAEAVSIVLETYWLPRFLEAGWNPRPLGLPETIDGEPTTAILCDVSEEVLEATRALRGIAAPVLRARGDQDWIERRPEMPAISVH